MTTSTDPWRQRFLKAGSYRTRVLEAGPVDADPVLLLHDGAWGGSASSSWSELIPLLAETHRVIAPDLIGFGESTKAVVFDQAPVESRIDHVADLLDVLGVREPVHAVGCSFGGALGLRAIVRDRAPFAIRSVTSICGAGGANARTPLAIQELGTWDGSRHDLARILRYLVDESTPLFEAFLDERLRCAQQPGHYRAVMAASLPIPDALKQTVQDAWPEQLVGTTVPLHLIRGTEDVLLTDDWDEQIARVRTDVVLTPLAAKHAPQLDHPVDVATALVDFFARV